MFAASTAGPRTSPRRAGAFHISLECADIQDPSILELGKFDLTLCFGLLPVRRRQRFRLIARRGVADRPATRFNPNGMTVDIRDLPSWSRYRFLAGANKYIQQESTFWRRSLWEKAGSELNASYRDVGDFDLWVRFFRHARLYSVDALIGGYRFHSDSISATDMDRYNQRCDKIIESELKSTPRAGAVKAFRRVSSAVKNIPKVRGLWQRVALKGLYHLAGPDRPPVVEDQENKWVIRENTRRLRGLIR